MKKRSLGIHLIVVLIMMPITGCMAQALQTQDRAAWNATSQPVFPTDRWMQYETPEAAGWSSAKLAAVQEMSNRAGTAAAMLIYNGAIVSQWGQTNRRYMCHSIRKSLLSALYGIAVAEGQIDTNETMGQLGINDTTPLTDLKKSAKISDLLKARSGVYLPAAYETASMKARRPERGSYEPGSHWYCNNWDFKVLATIYNQETAGDLFRAFETNFAVPLQMQDFALRHTYYHLEPEHSLHAAYPFRMSARDLARFGLLFLNHGKWKDRQIVSADWVRESTAPYSTYPNGGYGYMWWTLPERSEPGKLGTYAAFGYGGHSIYIVPGANLVFVHRADTYQGKRKHVSSSSVRNMLQAVLKARTTAPVPAPNLVTLDDPPFDGTDNPLSKAQLAGLSGEYARDNFIAKIREQEGHLEITSPRWGNYFLYPEKETIFVAEDAQKQVEFVLDANQNATAIKIWFSPDEPYEMLRLPTQN